MTGTQLPSSNTIPATCGVPKHTRAKQGRFGSVKDERGTTLKALTHRGEDNSWVDAVGSDSLRAKFHCHHPRELVECTLRRTVPAVAKSTVRTGCMSIGAAIASFTTITVERYHGVRKNAVTWPLEAKQGWACGVVWVARHTRRVPGAPPSMLVKRR
jgi:hypothetical protein